ncbi:uncharacterized protein PHACADRAFT_98583 [Phanerochaete carnosa HHB-10118-sp]|uniref:Protein kinase domain-containing protein n=1 Tax=Phanerochaete carnosa (strain HHB-10118-sp) TaxID=650164 RepID=K5VNC6_PHACS|nr:uncharacterized protein PHACADRAFT_98583 [Phanerochaete carnosa HHB-10118-sp]EKM52953.1 hypothetical protein PHACADRAFT_98583 [Phanerochaete carnosa HHB-10118-sp]
MASPDTQVYNTVPDVSHYPECSPFDMDPPLYNLVPAPLDSMLHDTPELLANVLAVAERTNTNLFCTMYGTNPLNIADPNFYLTWYPWVDYSAPPPLPEVALSENFRVLEQLNPKGNSPLFLVELDDQKMLLKVFPDRDALQDEDTDDDDDDSWGRDKSKPDPRALFRRECEAYAHLLHFGICKRGVVPNCYGRTTLSTGHISKLMALSVVSDTVRALPNEELPPKGILIEYLANAERLSHRNITPEIAQAALRALNVVHTGNVLHGDVHQRNILLLPDKRVVWIDFDCSCCVSSRRLMRQDFVRELRDAWSYFYERLVSFANLKY